MSVGGERPGSRKCCFWCPREEGIRGAGGVALSLKRMPFDKVEEGVVSGPNRPFPGSGPRLSHPRVPLPAAGNIPASGQRPFSGNEPSSWKTSPGSESQSSASGSARSCKEQRARAPADFCCPGEDAARGERARAASFLAGVLTLRVGKAPKPRSRHSFKTRPRAAVCRRPRTLGLLSFFIMLFLRNQCFFPLPKLVTLESLCKKLKSYYPLLVWKF